MAQATIKRERRFPFTVDEQEIRRLLETIDQCFRDMEKGSDGLSFSHEFSVSHADGSTYTTTELDEVFRDENPDQRSINEITITSQEDSSPPRSLIELELSLRKRQPIIIYKVVGPSVAWTQLVASRLEDRLVRLREWYSWMIDPTNWGAVTGGIIGIVLWVLFYNKIVPAGKTAKDLPETLKFINGITFFLFPFVGLIGGVYVFGSLFPVANFRFGDGVRRYDKATKWRERVFGLIIIGLLVTVVGGAILMLFTGS